MMQITMAMIWDLVNAKHPSLETTIYDSHPVRGIKLLPDTGVIESDFLYVTRHEDGMLLSCNGFNDILRTDIPMDILFNELQDIFNRLRDWDMETHLALIEGADTQKLLDISQNVLENPVTLMDPSYKLLARTSHSKTSSHIFNQVSQCGYLPADTVEFYRIHGYLADLAKSKEELVCLSEGACISVIYPLRIKENIVGFMTMPCVERPYSQGMAECFRYLAKCIALCMERQQHSTGINHYMHSYFLIELIDGHPFAPDEIAERLQYIELPMQGRFRLVELGAESLFGMNHYLSRKLSDILPNERVFPFRNSVFVFMNESHFEWVMDTLKPFAAEYGAVCGISRVFTNLPDIRQAYNQTAAALRLGQQISCNRTLARLGVEYVRYDDTVFFYDRYAGHHMLEQAAKERRLSPKIERLVSLDRQGNTDHLRVLHAFLQWERRPTQTAAFLHMHRNNVIYRIDRLKTLLDISLEDPAVRMELECSLLVLELISPEDIQQNAQ
ncbi:MAG: helix-turn-helix domain-containing protein [Oscillospiraceae bacterium]|nr:helix-turn-helix domain-containing protein [Oscillospiraceae bacterium]